MFDGIVFSAGLGMILAICLWNHPETCSFLAEKFRARACAIHEGRRAYRKSIAETRRREKKETPRAAPKDVSEATEAHA